MSVKSECCATVPPMLRLLVAMVVMALPLTLTPASARAQDTMPRHDGMTMQRSGPIDTNRIGLMSPVVIKQKFKMLGYSDVQIIGSERRLVTVNGMKAGKAVAVQLDPITGHVTEYKGRFERRPEGVMLRALDGRYTKPDTGVRRRPG